jgi:uncharacterized glyoxalase superfamily protein PhnB
MKLTSLAPMLPVAHLPTSISFYEKIGFTVEHREDRWGWAMLRFDSCRLMLDQSIAQGDRAARRSVVYLYPDDVAEFHRRVQAAGLPAPDLALTFYGMREFRLLDPDGNQLWIGQNVPAP